MFASRLSALVLASGILLGAPASAFATDNMGRGGSWGSVSAAYRAPSSSASTSPKSSGSNGLSQRSPSGASASASASAAIAKPATQWKAADGKSLTGREGSIRIFNRDVHFGRKVEATLRSGNGGGGVQQTTNRTWGISKATTTDRHDGRVVAKGGLMVSTSKTGWSGGSSGYGHNGSSSTTIMAGSKAHTTEKTK